MIIKPLQKLRKRLGKAYVPLLLSLFFIGLNGLIYTSVKQNIVDYSEGQVADSNIRANKTIENKSATQQKQTVAAEAVTPEYTYSQDIATAQKEHIEELFDLITTVRKESSEEDQKRTDAAGEKETPQLMTDDEKIAALKKKFEQVDADDLTFYQRISSNFLQLIFGMSDEEVAQVESESLNIINAKMADQIRQSTLSNVKSDATSQVDYLNESDDEKEAIKYLVSQGIVVNSFLNESKTEELKQAAMDAVQPVMIYQGEIIVREGSQIDANALQKLELLGMTSSEASIYSILAMVLVVLFQIVVLVYFMRVLKDRDQQENYLTFYVVLMLLSVLVMKFFQIFQTESVLYTPLLFPAAFTPLVLNLFMNRRSGVLAALFQVLFATIIFYEAMGTNILIIILISYLFSGLMGTLITRIRIIDQGKTAFVLLIIFPLLLSLILEVFQGASFSDSRTWITLICSVAGNILSLLLTVGLHQYLELLVTDDSVIVLNELSNPNHPLLKQLLEEAPGTYHHSMMVANLSANAVAEIGGRSLLTRVACYYHDIGKIKHANFFVENLPQGAENPHNFLLPEDSKQIIFGHVTDGAEILEKEKMPQFVIDICRQHHGTTLMKFFYFKAKERDPKVTEADFRYPGPKPQTKEAGIVSIADTCEAAVRAMDSPTNEKIKKFVADVINERILDGQLDESGLTLGEIRIMEKSLVSGLCSTFHSRIKYPKMKSEAEQMKEEQERGEI